MTRRWWLGGCVAVCPGVVLGQGFGAIKQPVTLERKLPAAVKLPGNTFSVRATSVGAGSQFKAMAADKLQSLVETDLIQGNNQLTPDPAAPETAISIRVLNCAAVSTPEYGLQFGKNAGRPQQPTGFKVAADLSVTYEARNRAGGFVDAEPLDVKYNHEFNNTTAAISGLMGKGQKGEQEPHTPEELVEVLADRMAERIAARLVNTNEKVEVLLGKGGPLDEANRYAVAGQWSRYVETLETMPPLAKATDDSYRLYNIGVGDEALGYKAETPTAAQKYFEQAVVQYRKAGEMNPREKYFIQPVNRIEVALEHYKALAQPAQQATEPASSAVTPPSPPPPAPAPATVPPRAPATSSPRAPAAAAGPTQRPGTWRITEMINGVPVIWLLIANNDLSFRATMGDAVVANGRWQYNAANRTFNVTGNNLVLRQPFRCAFTFDAAHPDTMNGVCLDQLGTRYRSDAVRQ